MAGPVVALTLAVAVAGPVAARAPVQLLVGGRLLLAAGAEPRSARTLQTLPVVEGSGYRLSTISGPKNIATKSPHSSGHCRLFMVIKKCDHLNDVYTRRECACSGDHNSR